MTVAFSEGMNTFNQNKMNKHNLLGIDALF